MKMAKHHSQNAAAASFPFSLSRRFLSGMPSPAWQGTAGHATAVVDRVHKGPGAPIAAAGTPAPACRHSPREMAELSLDLFLAGVLSDEEYALLAFQPELHPDFDRTIGALTGERADPDQPRDYVAIWRDRLEFERSRSRPDRDLIDQIQRILFVLRRLGTAAGMTLAAP
jgi:hypothetical protein